MINERHLSAPIAQYSQTPLRAGLFILSNYILNVHVNYDEYLICQVLFRAYGDRVHYYTVIEDESGDAILLNIAIHSQTPWRAGDDIRSHPKLIRETWNLTH